MQLRSSTVKTVKRSAEPVKAVAKRKRVKREAKPKAAKEKDEKEAPKEVKEVDEKEEKPKKAKKTPKAPKTPKAKAEDVGLAVGSPIPDLTLHDQNDSAISLSELGKAHILVIFVYPRASTPGCTRQAKGFRDNYEELVKLGATVVGLSSDSPKAQTNFKVKQGLQYDLLCDPERELMTVLGCKKPAGQRGGTIRSHFVFVDGVLKVKHVKISPEKSVEGALEEVKEIAAEKKE